MLPDSHMLPCSTAAHSWWVQAKMIVSLHYGGAASCVCGGILYLLGWAHGKYASQLQSAQRLAQLAEVKDLIDLVPLLVAVEGTAWTEAPLDCELTTRPAVMAQVWLAGACS